jgi:predicted nuclease of predicted toxin-antitoxin system
VNSIRFYTDEHVSRAVIRGLRQRGVDVLTVSEAGMMQATDEAHLDRALREGRVLFTQDTDFLRLAASDRPHAGIIYTRQHTPVGTIIQGLMLVYQLLNAEDMFGRVEYL